MALAYIGTATRYGLESFLPEDQDSIAASAARILQGTHPRRIGFFATVSDEVAARVRSQLHAGERFEALLTLEADAVELAPLCPWPQLFESASRG